MPSSEFTLICMVAVAELASRGALVAADPDVSDSGKRKQVDAIRHLVNREPDDVAVRVHLDDPE